MTEIAGALGPFGTAALTGTQAGRQAARAEMKGNERVEEGEGEGTEDSLRRPQLKRSLDEREFSCQPVMEFLCFPGTMIRYVAV